jgi:hypothetical protein
MTNFSEIAASVAKHLSRDDARKSAIIAANPQVFYALDAGELDQMSASEAAARTLKERGVRLNTGEDGLRALELFNAGMDWGRGAARFGGQPGSWSADAADLPSDNALAKFFHDLGQT